MDNDDLVMRDTTPVGPVGGSDYGQTHPPVGTVEDTDRNPVFSSLVTADNDVVGLVAYSIYKQNKLDWLLAFQRTVGREPNEHENTAYIIGEATPRRLATYRHLAESTLAGSGPDVASGKSGDRSGYAYPGKPGAPNRTTTILVYVILAIVVIIAIIAAVKFLPRT